MFAPKAKKAHIGDAMDRSRSTDRGPYIGRSLPRFEDLRLVRGAGRYSDDVSLDGQAYAYFLRSPHAHAKVKRIDTAKARATKGVVAVLTCADYLADGCKGFMQRPNPAGAIDIKVPAFAPEKRPILDERQFPLVHERVRYPGEAVAMVIAERLWTARDAAEAIEVEYETLPAVTDIRKANGGEPIWPSSTADNVALDQEFGDLASVKAAFAAADLVVEQTFRNQRIANCQMEPRSGVASYDHATDSYTLISGNQGVHVPRRVLAESMGVTEDKIRFICPDVGGGFGLRNNLYPEQAAILWAAKRVGRPVKWTNDRSESFLTDYAGRDLVTTARLALTADGRITAYQVDHVGTTGGQTVTYVPLSQRVPRRHHHVRHSADAHALPRVVTNTVPTAPFRGAGRPEATLVLERLIDLAAARLGMDRVKLRQKNLITRSKLPYRTASGLALRQRRFHRQHEAHGRGRRLEGLCRARREPRRRGKLRGIGISNYVETPVGIPHERVEVTVLPDRQGRACGRHAIDRPGPRDNVRAGDGRPARRAPQRTSSSSAATPQLVASGSGTHSDRSMRLAGTLMVEASNEVIGQAKAVAAKLLDVAEADIDFSDGLFVTPKSNRRLTIYDVAQALADNPCPRRRRSSCTPRRPSPAASRPTPPAARSARSRSTPTPARSRSCAMARSTTPASRSIR